MEFNNLPPTDKLSVLLDVIGADNVRRYLNVNGNTDENLANRIAEIGIVEAVNQLMHHGHEDVIIPNDEELAETLPSVESINLVARAVNIYQQQRAQRQQNQQQHVNFQIVGNQALIYTNPKYSVPKAWKMLPTKLGTRDMPHDLSYMIDAITALKMEDMKIVFFLEKDVEGATLTEKINNENNKDRFLHICFGYSESLVNDLKRAEGIKDNYDFYEATKSFHSSADNIRERYENMTMLLTIYLILAANHFKFGQIEMRVYVNYQKRSLMSTILRYLVKVLKQDLIRDLNTILNTDGSLYCNACNAGCGFKHELWHFNLANFVQRNYDNNMATTGDFMDKTNLYRNHLGTALQVYKVLRRNYDTTRQCSRFGVMRTLRNVIQMSTETKQLFNTYLLLFIEDDSPLRNSTPAELFARNKPHFYYVGETTEGNYRKSLFRNASPRVVPSDVAQLVSDRMRVFLLRNAISPNLLDILYDEAHVYVQLKSIRLIRQQEFGHHNFIVVNKNAIPYAMVGCSTARYQDIDNFSRSNRAVFNSIAFMEAPSISEIGQFEGNYNLMEITDEVRGLYQPPDNDVAWSMQQEIIDRNILNEKRNHVAVVNYPIPVPNV